MNLNLQSFYTATFSKFVEVHTYHKNVIEMDLQTSVLVLWLF